MKHDAIRQIFEKDKKAVEKKSRSVGRRGHKRLNPDGSDKFYNGVNNKFLNYEQAKLFCHAAVFITSANEYKEWVRIKKYKFLPLTPNIKYQDEWEGWGEFLGTGNPAPSQRRVYMSYIDAKRFAQKMAVKHDLLDGDLRANWLRFLDSQILLPEKERDVTSEVNRNPQEYYDEWEGWRTFMGKTVKSKVDALQEHRRKIENEIKEDFYAKYNGVPLVALVSNFDPVNPTTIRVMVNNTGLLGLLMDCDRIQGQMICAFRFDAGKTQEILNILNSHGISRGGYDYILDDVRRTTTELSQIMEQVPPEHLK